MRILQDLFESNRVSVLSNFKWTYDYSTEKLTHDYSNSFYINPLSGGQVLFVLRYLLI